MNEEEKKAIERMLRGKNFYLTNSDVVIANLISKLQKELEKSNKRTDMCIDLLNEEGCLNFNTKQEKLDYIDKLIKLEVEDE